MQKELAFPLTVIFNRSLGDGILPKEWKLANVTALFKKGNRSIPGNYRPVSLTCIACKILEGIVKEQIIAHMMENKLFSTRQFGFLPGRSTVLQLIKVIDKWTEIIDNKGRIDVAFCDFMKAFDKVPHKRLILKLKMYKIGNAFTDWIIDFLKDRKQRVRVGDTFSDWKSITSGVPQGSVLGPLLFLIYINDLPDCAENSQVYLFADDTKIFKGIYKNEDCEKLQEDIRKMEEWTKKWLLRFHPEKCKFMRVGTSEADEYVYSMNNQNLTYVNSEKDLGVVIDEKLSFESHINEKVNKANMMVGLIRRSFEHLDEETFLVLYKSLVRPVLEYANAVWNPHKKKHINSIENVQKRATKMIPGFGNLSYPDRLKKLGLPTLVYRRMRGDMIEMYKIMTEKYDSEVLNLFEINQNVTRGHKFKVIKERPRLDIRKYNFTHRVVNHWNSLSEEVVDSESVKIFEKRLDDFWSEKEFKFDHLRFNFESTLR